MSSFDDDRYEMPQARQIDDELIEALLTGAHDGGGNEDLMAFASFATDVRMTARHVPVPSAALMAALPTVISTDKGDLPATAASNVYGPATQVSGLPKWRKVIMNIKAYVAGLGVVAKIGLGAGLAAAATTGAGVAGGLPPALQHAVSNVVEAVTPFSVPKSAPPAVTEHPKTPEPASTAPHVDPASGNVAALGASTSSKEHAIPASPPRPSTTTTAAPTSEPTHSGSGSPTVAPKPSSEPAPAPTTTTTAKPAPAPTTESSNPESIKLSCAPAREPNRVTCRWSASIEAGHAKYALLRTTPNEPGRVVYQSPDGLSFTDTNVTAGTSYGYRVISLRADGSVDSHSNLVTLSCC